MPAKNRSQNRHDRNAGKRKDHGPLLNLVKEETGRRAPKKGNAKPPSPLTDRQALYENSIKVNDITFGIGPAGTGKTWYAAMMAAHALDKGEIERIVITRPAVEAGENLGFLPGELEEKYEPFFRPVRDALIEYFGEGHLEYMIKAETIEARPMAFLRGASIKNTWLIADEMQNATRGQILMLLTRIGEGSKFIINGDPAQTDLPRHSPSGLADAVNRLSRLKTVGAVQFTADDIVRHGLIQDIIEAYEKTDESEQSDRYNSNRENDNDGLNRFLKVNDN